MLRLWRQIFQFWENKLDDGDFYVNLEIICSLIFSQIHEMSKIVMNKIINNVNKYHSRIKLHVASYV